MDGGNLDSRRTLSFLQCVQAPGLRTRSSRAKIPLKEGRDSRAAADSMVAVTVAMQRS